MRQVYQQQQAYYEGTMQQQTKTPSQVQSSQINSNMNSPKIVMKNNMMEERTPNCLTQRNSQIISNCTLSPYLKNVIISEQQLNMHLDSIVSNNQSNNSGRQQQQQQQQSTSSQNFSQQNFSGGNFISSQPQHQLVHNKNQNMLNNSRLYAQQQQNYRSIQIPKNTPDYNGIDQQDQYDGSNQQLSARTYNGNTTGGLNDYSQQETYCNTTHSNNYLSNNNNIQNLPNSKLNKYYLDSGVNYQSGNQISAQQLSQNVSAEHSQNGMQYDQNLNQINNLQINQGNNYKQQAADLKMNPLQNIEQENLMSSMQEKIKLLTTENEEQKKKIRNMNEQFSKSGKNETVQLYEKLHTISNQIQSLSSSQLKLDLRKLNNPENASQFKIDSSRSYGRGVQIQQAESQYSQRDILLNEIARKENEAKENQKKSKGKSHRSNSRHHHHHHHHTKSNRKKKNTDSSSNSSITSSSNSESGHSPSSSSSASSSSSSDNEYKKHHKRKHSNKGKNVKGSQLSQYNIPSDRVQTNRSASRKDRKKSALQRENLEMEILRLGSQAIKEVNLNKKLRDLFMQKIGSTESFRRMLVEKSYTKAFAGLLKVFLDVLTIINFNKSSTSPHSPAASCSPMSQMINTSSQINHSLLQRNPILSQSRYLPSHQQLKTIDTQNYPISQVNQTFQSPLGGNYVPGYLTERIQSQHSGSHSPITSHSFVSVKQGNYFNPGQSTRRTNSPPNQYNQSGLNASNNQIHQNQYYSMHNQIHQASQGGQGSSHNGSVGSQIQDLNISNINHKSNNVQHSQPLTVQTSGSDTYRQNFDSFMQPSPKVINGIQNIPAELQKYVQSPYFNQGNNNSSAKKKQNDKEVTNQYNYKKKLLHKEEWNDQKHQQEEREYEQYQKSRTPKAAAVAQQMNDNRQMMHYQNTQQNVNPALNVPHSDRSHYRVGGGVGGYHHNNQVQQQIEQIFEGEPEDNNHQQMYNYNQQFSNQEITQEHINSKPNNYPQEQKSKQNKTNTNQSTQQIQINSKTRNISPNTLLPPKEQLTTNRNNQHFIQKTMVSQQTEQNQFKKGNDQKLHVNTQKNSNLYQISSSVPEIEMDSDSQVTNQELEAQLQIPNQNNQKSNKNIKSQTIQIPQRKKSQNRSFVFDDDSLSTHSASNNKMTNSNNNNNNQSLNNKKMVGFTPKHNNKTTTQATERRASHSPAIGLMPCMKSAKTPQNGGTTTPSKVIGSINNFKSDLSAKGSHTNLDSRNNSMYSHKNYQTETTKQTKAAPVSIEFVGAKKKVFLDSVRSRDFDIINGHQINSQHVTTSNPSNLLQVPQIKIVDTESTTPRSANQNNDNKTPSLRNEEQ